MQIAFKLDGYSRYVLKYSLLGTPVMINHKVTSNYIGNNLDFENNS